MTPRRLASVAVLLAVLGVALWAGRRSSVPAAPSASPSEALPGPPALARRGPVSVTVFHAAGDGGSGSTGGPEPEAFARLGWGSGEGKLGRNRPSEGNPEAPMSLTVDASGTLWILDQVNGRLVKVDAQGKAAGEVKLPVQAPQDVVVTRDGTTLVLDRLVDKAVGVVGPDGAPRGDLPIVGKGLSEGGAATGVFVDGKDVYVEREHGDLVRVGSTDGKPDAERPEVPGRPTRDGKHFVTANIVNATGGVVMLTVLDRPSAAHRFTRQYALSEPVLFLNLLDSDLSGTIALGAVTMPSAPSAGSGAPPPATITVLCLSPDDGRLLGHAVFPANGDPDETFRELTLGDDGTLYFLQRTEDGAQVLKKRCEP